MKFGISIPDSLKPAFLRSDKKAMAKFESELSALKAENDNLKKKGPKRVSLNLTKRRQYVATMQQDELKLAVEYARNPDRPRRDLLYPIYEEVWDNDGHTIGETRKAILKVVGSPFGVFKKGSDEIDEQATRLLQKRWFEDYGKYFQQANFFGHSLVQLAEWCKSTEPGMQFEVKRVELIDRNHVRPEDGFIVMDMSHETGIPFRDERFKRDLMLIEMGDPKYLGLLRVAAKEFIWKNYSRSDWSRHSEKFGMPMIAIKAATTDTQELDKLEAMAKDFGSNLYMILDPDDEVELKETTFKDAYKIYLELVKLANEEVSKAISGSNGTSDQKAYVGAAEVQERVLNDFVEANKRSFTYHVNEDLFPMLTEHGYPFADKEFRYLNYQENDIDEDGLEAEDKKPGKPKGAGGGPAKKSQASARFTLRMT